MDSKYNITNKLGGISKFRIKPKPTPIVFNSNKNGPSSPKKIKLMENENTTNSLNNKQQQNKPKLSIQEQKINLPIYDKRNKLIELIKRNNTLIILGETGSGKTTQIPQYIQAAKLHNKGRIAVTQPRRVAAISVAHRVAQEYGNGVRAFIITLL